MRLLVCGDRNWTDYDLILSAIVDLWPSTVIEGEARGVDSLAASAAHLLGIAVAPFPANWGLYGRDAGYIRNQQMLDEGKPDMILAFHDDLGHSKGTADMVWRAEHAGVPVRVISHSYK
ncbi:MAG: SLOG family protein [Chloroflexota bacterium]|nr:SLOG family protein [Chloroflexota bacterium]